MKTIKIICMTTLAVAKQVFLFPKTLVDAVRQKRQHALLKENEVERLDRIRHPSKYVGK
jgi:hypothetical protein